MKSRREMLELVKTSVMSDHTDYYSVDVACISGLTIRLGNKLRKYRVYVVQSNKAEVRCVNLRDVTSNGFSLGYKSNGELISSYGYAQYGMQIPYTTLNKRLRYR